jgi:hypothetical protein
MISLDTITGDAVLGEFLKGTKLCMDGWHREAYVYSKGSKYYHQDDLPARGFDDNTVVLYQWRVWHSPDDYIRAAELAHHAVQALSNYHDIGGQRQVEEYTSKLLRTVNYVEPHYVRIALYCMGRRDVAEYMNVKLHTELNKVMRRIK